MTKYLLLNSLSLIILYCHNLFASAPAPESPSTILASIAPTNAQPKEPRPALAKINTLTVEINIPAQNYLALPSPDRKIVPTRPESPRSLHESPKTSTPVSAGSTNNLASPSQNDSKHKQPVAAQEHQTTQDAKIRLNGAVRECIDTIYQTSIYNPAHIRNIVLKAHPELDLNTKDGNEALSEYSLELYVKPLMAKEIKKYWLYKTISIDSPDGRKKISDLVNEFIAKTNSKAGETTTYVMSLRDMMHDVWVPTFADQASSCCSALFCCLAKTRNRATVVPMCATPKSAATSTNNLASAPSQSTTHHSFT